MANTKANNKRRKLYRNLLRVATVQRHAQWNNKSWKQRSPKSQRKMTCYFKERYCLLFVVGCNNFMWATPTTLRMEPEDL
eukprot:2215346-Rhodomonas_salina.1